MIRVRYPDGLSRMVCPSTLHQLITTRKIYEFHRADGWVRLGIDPIRHRRAPDYPGPERRDGPLVKLQRF
jgi:hypothetical protein